MRPQLVAGMLTAGFVVFWLGAGWWSLDFQQDDVAATLHSIADQRFRWAWTNAFMGAGALVTATGYRLWAKYQARQGSSVAANALGATFYQAGAVLWVAAIALRLTVTVSAATGSPAGYPAFDQLGQGLLAAHLFLSHAAAVVFGFGLVRSGARAVGLGAIGLGAFLGIGLAIGPGVKQALMAPFLAHLATVLFVVFLVVRYRRSPVATS